MKQSKFNPRYVTAVAIASFAALVSACGSSNNGSTNNPVIAPGIGGGTQCTPLSQSMAFTGYTGYIDSSNLYAGTQPQGSQYTQFNSQLGISVGGMQTSGNQYVNTIEPPTFQGGQQRITSWISYLGINVQSSGYVGTGPGYGYGTTGQQTPINGTFTFSQAAWSYLTSILGGAYGNSYLGQIGTYGTTIPNYGSPYGQTSLSTATVCQMGINSGLALWGTGQGTLYGGYIYLTINGTQTQFPI